MLFIVLFQTETNFVYLWEGYEATTIKTLKTERDQLRSEAEAPPVVPSFAQASKRQHRDCARPPSSSTTGLRRNLDTRVHSSGLRTVQLADRAGCEGPGLDSAVSDTGSPRRASEKRGHVDWSQLEHACCTKKHVKMF